MFECKPMERGWGVRLFVAITISACGMEGEREEELLTNRWDPERAGPEQPPGTADDPDLVPRIDRWRELFSVSAKGASDDVLKGAAVDMSYRPRAIALHLGGVRLSRLQADTLGDNAQNGYLDDDPDDGGWDHDVAVQAASHSITPSPENTYGVTAIGLLASHVAAWGAEPRFLTAMLDAYLGIEKRSEVDSPPDFAFLCLLTLATHNRGYAELARQKYDQKLSDSGGPLDLAASIRQSRADAGQDGLFPFDVGWLVIAALNLELQFPQQGYFEHARIFGEAVASDLEDAEGVFDPNDPSEPYHVLGVAWAATATFWSGADVLLSLRLRRLLMELQYMDGSWPWNANFPGGNHQSTAAAVTALALPGLFASVRRAATAGADWLSNQQQSSGGWEYAPGLENTEIDAESLLALFLTPRGIHDTDSGATYEDDTAIQSSRAASTGSVRGATAVAMPVQ